MRRAPSTRLFDMKPGYRSLEAAARSRAFGFCTSTRANFLSGSREPDHARGEPPVGGHPEDTEFRRRGQECLELQIRHELAGIGEAGDIAESSTPSPPRKAGPLRAALAGRAPLGPADPIPGVAALDRRIGHAHRKHRVAAVAELPLQDQGFKIAHRRAHAAIALAKRDKHRVERMHRRRAGASNRQGRKCVQFDR